MISRRMCPFGGMQKGSFEAQRAKASWQEKQPTSLGGQSRSQQLIPSLHRPPMLWKRNPRSSKISC
jgi:hypothetical protein